MRRVGIVLFLLFSGSLCRPPTRADDRQSPEKPPGDTLPFFVENLSQDTAFSSGLEVAISVEGTILGCWYTLLSPGVVGQRTFCRMRVGLQWGPIMIVDTGFAFGVAWDRRQGFWVVYQVDRVLEGGTRSADILIRHLDATTGEWSERVPLSDTSNSTDYASDPWVRVDETGQVHVVWDDNLNMPRTVYRGNDGTGWGNREEFESGFNREVEVTEIGEVWVVQEEGAGTSC